MVFGPSNFSFLIESRISLVGRDGLKKVIRAIFY